MKFPHLYSKKAGYLIFIFLLFVVIRKMTYPAKSLPLHEVNVTISNSTSTYFKQQLIGEGLSSDFKQQLINERLSSYFRIYNDSHPVCNMMGSLTMNQQQAFHTMSELLMKFRKQIVSYPNEYFRGRGIVLTVGQGQLKFAKVNLKMLELTRTRLSVQIWYSSSQIGHGLMTDLLRLVPKLNASVCCFHAAECRTLTGAWKLNSNYVYKPRTNYAPKIFPYKPASIISSTFAEVLFLDCDAYAVRDPEELFLSDPMYLKFGALFFPDAVKSRQDPAVWKLFNTTCAQNEYEFDSAMILVDKKRVWNGLYMTKLMNDDNELFYKHVTDGDKDTFRLAFRYMQIRYYLVLTPCATGIFTNNHFCGLTLCKTDSLSQHIYINHAHFYKYVNINYSPTSLGYTRIGLGDPNNNSFIFHLCRPRKTRHDCFHILKESNEQLKQSGCHNGEIPLDEIEDHEYKVNEPLLSERSKNNRVLISKTDNLMPHFVGNVLRSATHFR